MEQAHACKDFRADREISMTKGKLTCRALRLKRGWRPYGQCSGKKNLHFLEKFLHDRSKKRAIKLIDEGGQGLSARHLSSAVSHGAAASAFQGWGVVENESKGTRKMGYALCAGGEKRRMRAEPGRFSYSSRENERISGRDKRAPDGEA